MAKKGWFSIVKKLFTSSSTKEKREKRRKWVFGKLKNKRFPSIEASKETRVREDEEEEKNNHALKVAIASAAAAEAAITAAQAAVEVIRLQSVHQHKGKPEEESQSTHQCQRKKIEESSAIKIQTAFRGYLARKALKALKGIVKLQAIIRGRAVRRQAMSTLKCLQSIVSIQSQVIARKLQMAEGKWNSNENEEMQSSTDKIIRMDSNSERRWDDKMLLKKEVDGSCMIKKEDDALRRERIKEYSYYHRKSAESERNKVNGRWRYWMEQWVDTQLSKSKELEDSDSVFSSHFKKTQLKIKQMHKQNVVEELDSPIFSSSIPSSPSIPTYMAATKSTKAKVRSSSTPRTRGNLEMNSDFSCYSPCKRKISIAASINNEVPSNGRNNNQQRSPTLKGLSRP